MGDTLGVSAAFIAWCGQTSATLKGSTLKHVRKSWPTPAQVGTRQGTVNDGRANGGIEGERVKEGQLTCQWLRVMGPATGDRGASL